MALELVLEPSEKIKNRKPVQDKRYLKGYGAMP
jgi:hypothetical protein